MITQKFKSLKFHNYSTDIKCNHHLYFTPLRMATWLQEVSVFITTFNTHVCVLLVL